jgi:arabinan endo-1,5-alpha-L-arabinosidase
MTLVLLAMTSMFASVDPVVGLPDGSIFPGDGFVAKGSQGVHDPTVVDFGGRWFCFHTNGNGFATLRVSDDLKAWKTLGPVMPEAPDWLKTRMPHRSIWAPDVIKIGNGLRMYYSASERFGGNGSVIGFADCANFDPKNPQVGWVDRGLVIESVQDKDVFNAIDPEVEVDASGRHWLFFGSYFAGIHLIELNPETGKVKDPTLTGLFCVARNTDERGNPLEAPAVCYRDGFYYLFVSYGLAAQGIRSTYRIMVGRSKEITGPYLDRAGRSMVDGGHTDVLKGSPPMFAPGHSDILKAPDGRWLMPYHFYDGREFWHRDTWGLPTLQIREIYWSKDGWPLPGMPTHLAKRGPNRSPVGQWIHQADFGRPSKLTLRKDGSFTDGEAAGRWILHGDTLSLKWPKKESADEVWLDEVEVHGDTYVGRNQAGLVIRGARVPGGK